jgi:Fur family transcriptional regulator, ferric uptake regulator
VDDQAAQDARFEGRQTFAAYLRDHGLPVTAQRLAIADVILGHDRHFSADDVAKALRAQGAAAGTATVYRTIEVAA